MNSFRTPLIVEVLPSGKKFKLHYQFIYKWRYGELFILINVPKGFVTDLASIPRLARLVIPKLGRYNKAAVIHDYLYRYSALSRKQADQCFRDAMKDLSVAKWEYTLMYWAVRIGGWMIWKKGQGK